LFFQAWFTSTHKRLILLNASRILNICEFIITENLTFRGEDGEEGVKKAFLPHRDLNASISIARRVMGSAGWGER
jgi:hypothetical protein